MKITVENSLFIIASTILLMGCGKESSKEVIDDIVVEPIINEIGGNDYFVTGISFPNTASSVELSFNSNVSWSITSSENGWINFSKLSGSSGISNVTISVTSNTSFDQRSAFISIKAGSLVKKIKITQSQKDVIYLSKNVYNIEREGEIISAEITCNVPYSVVVNENCKDWVSLLPSTKNISKDNITMSISPNNGLNDREGVVLFNGENISDTLFIIQKGGPYLYLLNNSCKIDAKKQNIKVVLLTNTEYTIYMPKIDWISQSTVKKDTLFYEVSENKSRDERNVQITYSSVGDSGIFSIFSISQQGCEKGSYDGEGSGYEFE